jgi:hypothetical protein
MPGEPDAVESLRERHIDASGIDVSDFAIARIHDPIKPFCRRASVTDAELAIANFCAHTRDILFSSSPTDFREATHSSWPPSRRSNTLVTLSNT